MPNQRPNPEPEHPSMESLLIVHEPSKCGGPFGIFSSNNRNPCLSNALGIDVVVCVEVDGQGDMAEKLKKELEIYAINPGLSWFDVEIDILLESLGGVLKNHFDHKKGVRYTQLELYLLE